jgi:hypothetical protein
MYNPDGYWSSMACLMPQSGYVELGPSYEEWAQGPLCTLCGIVDRGPFGDSFHLVVPREPHPKGELHKLLRGLR